jgi:hypothetical protein
MLIYGRSASFLRVRCYFNWTRIYIACQKEKGGSWKGMSAWVRQVEQKPLDPKEKEHSGSQKKRRGEMSSAEASGFDCLYPYVPTSGRYISVQTNILFTA